MSITSQETIQIVVAVSTLLSATMGMVMGFRNAGKIHNIYVSINHRMDELLRVTGVSAHAEGLEQGRLEHHPAPPEIP